MRTFTLILISAFLLAACNMPAIWKPGQAAAGPKQTPDAYARQLAEKGDSLAAAQEYFRLAANAQAPAKQTYHITGVEYLLRANLHQQAKEHLERMRDFALPEPVFQARMQLAYAHIDYAEHRLDQARSRLDGFDPAALPAETRSAYHFLRALVLETQGRYLEALAERVYLDGILATPLDIDSNVQALWRDVQNLPPAQLARPPANASTALAGWLALGLLSKTAPPAQLPQALAEWRARFPRHPAERTIVRGLAGGTLPGPGLAAPGQTRQIALLLPLSGDFQRAAETVRNGFLAAWQMEGQAQGVVVKPYNADQSNVVQAYREALDQGASLVVGPLNKDAVSALVNAYPSFPVPTLTLNYHIELGNPAGYTQRPNLFQFSLSAEDEARVVAALAWTDGRRRAAVLVPEGEWGNRTFSAFSRTWESLGGQLATYAKYGQDFPAAAKQIAQQREAADMLFIGAFPAQARQIRPHLAYQGAADLPVYATSQIYSGVPDARVDRDLNGVQFVDMPWVLITPPLDSPVFAPVQQTWRDMPAANKRLYALGIDAYRLITRVLFIPGQRTGQLQGETGLLWLDSLGVVHRELPRAVFSNGVPVLADALADEPPAPAP